jgi:dTDP-glucose 4,6-dehydratase
VVVIKLTVLVVAGAYRPLWRYFSTADAFGLAVATGLGSAALVIGVAVATGFANYARSVFVIDWLLCTAFLLGARISLSLLSEWFARVPRAESTRVLIVGADDRGDLVLRALRRDPAYRPVGYLDRDLSKQQRRLRGVPVLGTPRDLLAVAVATGAHEVIVAAPLAPGPEHDRFMHLCGELGLTCREAAAFVREHLPESSTALGAEA